MFTFTLDPVTVISQLVIPVFLPVLVGVVTKYSTRPGIKATLLAGLTLASQVLMEYVTATTAGTIFDLGQALTATIPAFTISVATHYGLWKPTGVALAAAAIANRDPKITPIEVHEAYEEAKQAGKRFIVDEYFESTMTPDGAAPDGMPVPARKELRMTED